MGGPVAETHFWEVILVLRKITFPGAVLLCSSLLLCAVARPRSLEGGICRTCSPRALLPPPRPTLLFGSSRLLSDGAEAPIGECKCSAVVSSHWPVAPHRGRVCEKEGVGQGRWGGGCLYKCLPPSASVTLRGFTVKLTGAVRNTETKTKWNLSPLRALFMHIRNSPAGPGERGHRRAV